MDKTSDTDSGIDRRAYLAALSAAGATGLAGCGGGESDGSNDNNSGGSDGDTDEQELGERVPTVVFGNMTGVAGASSIEQTNNHAAQNVQEHLGVSTDVQSFELGTFFSNNYNDAREYSFATNLSPPFMKFLDPSNLLSGYHIRNAGANGRPNSNNYAGCEFSEAFDAQATAVTREARQEDVTRAASAASEDLASLMLTTNVASGAYRTDQVNAAGVGNSGVAARNPDFIFESEPKGDADALNFNMTPTTINDAVYFKAPPPTPWNFAVYAPLLRFNKDFEVENYLATDYEISNGRKTYTFMLREDATFHNGDPVTAEDVKWTYEFMNENNSEFPGVTTQNYESINVVDEHTVEINFPKPNASYLNAFVPQWGILPKDVWIDAGAEENPGNPDFDEIIGSGPFQVEQFTEKEILALTPADNHWVDVDHDVVFRGYADRQAAFRAFQEGSLNVLINISTNTETQIQDNMSETGKVVFGETFVSWELHPQHSFAPSMFREFRHAVSQVINRQLVTQFLSGGKATPEMYAGYIGQKHPWYPENPEEALTKQAESPQPNPDAAKQILEDAGWGWDDQGRLHYPPDKDLTPAWPEDGTPCDVPEEFPCLPELCPE